MSMSRDLSFFESHELNTLSLEWPWASKRASVKMQFHLTPKYKYVKKKSWAVSDFWYIFCLMDFFGEFRLRINNHSKAHWIPFKNYLNNNFNRLNLDWDITIGNFTKRLWGATFMQLCRHSSFFFFLKESYVFLSYWIVVTKWMKFHLDVYYSIQENKGKCVFSEENILQEVLLERFLWKKLMMIITIRGPVVNVSYSKHWESILEERLTLFTDVLIV